MFLPLWKSFALHFVYTISLVRCCLILIRIREALNSMKALLQVEIRECRQVFPCFGQRFQSFAETPQQFESRKKFPL